MAKQLFYGKVPLMSDIVGEAPSFTHGHTTSSHEPIVWIPPIKEPRAARPRGSRGGRKPDGLRNIRRRTMAEAVHRYFRPTTLAIVGLIAAFNVPGTPRYS